MPGLGLDLRCVTYRSADGGTTSAFVPPVDAGTKTPLFLVPALALDGRSFAPFAPLAAERRVVFWNTPNELPTSPGLDDMTRVVIAHADRAGMPRRFVLGGSSLGAVLSLATALAAPDRIAGIVLMGGVASWDELGPRMRWAGKLHRLIPDRVYHKALARILVPGRVEPDSLGAALRVQMERRTKGYADSVISALRGAGNFDLRPRLGDVRAPTLIVHSLGDRVAPFAAAKTLATIPGATLAPFEGWSHLPYLDDPERFLGVLRPFLTSVDEREATR